ncbi:hypothetical protein CJU94_34910 (plasmid) [Paraburkholderia aromaticivorans]|uniref:Uncharacterized protein n=1 Tax=Paraburkholderia aromaticivorans TaxID=2026199 RepID=A0A248VWM8_9BURK|nr:hypothetical protein CJU94_34910 [Paraburkholderia aromaticivorans]
MASQQHAGRPDDAMSHAMHAPMIGATRNAPRTCSASGQHKAARQRDRLFGNQRQQQSVEHLPGVLRAAIVTGTAAVSNRVSTAPTVVSRRSASRSAADRPLSMTADGDRRCFRN